MISQSISRRSQHRKLRQRGIVVIFALIALVAMTLASLALLRSVDTSTLISGNLAFKQAATTSGDSGIESAMTAIATRQSAAANAGKTVYLSADYTLNVTSASTGYYSNADSALNLTADATWVPGTSSAYAGTTDNGNSIQYIVQRMCRAANQVLSTANCLFGGTPADTSGHATPLPPDICSGPGCPAAGQAPQYRVTARVTGPRNSISYIQAMVY